MKQKTVCVRELSNLRMVAGNEKKYKTVIHQGVVKDWVAFGWIELRKPTLEDKKKYPVVVG